MVLRAKLRLRLSDVMMLSKSLDMRCFPVDLPSGEPCGPAGDFSLVYRRFR